MVKLKRKYRVYKRGGRFRTLKPRKIKKKTYGRKAVGLLTAGVGLTGMARAMTHI